MYFEDLSMRRRINCASAHQNGGFRSSEKIERISAVCVLLVSRANLLSPWQTASNARKEDGSWNRVLKLSSCEVRRLKQFISCNLAVTCKEISEVCLILLLFADFSYICHRTALDRACLFTRQRVLKMGYFYWLHVRNSNHLHTELSWLPERHKVLSWK